MTAYTHTLSTEITSKSQFIFLSYNPYWQDGEANQQPYMVSMKVHSYDGAKEINQHQFSDLSQAVSLGNEQSNRNHCPFNIDEPLMAEIDELYN